MGGDSPSVPEPTQEERDLQRAQAEAVQTQNLLLQEQLAASQAAREQLSSISAISAAEQAQIRAFQSAQLDLATESLALQRIQIERAEALEPAQFALLTQQTEIAASQLQLLQDTINREPTELEAKQEEIALLQAERVEKALKGELPIGPQTLAAEKDEFKKLKEQLARAGIDVQGDDLEGATSTSTAGIQAIESLKKRFDAIKFAEQQGAITQGQSLLLQGAGAIADIEQRRLGTAFGNTGALVPQRQQFGLFDPVGSRLQNFGTAATFGFGAAHQGFSSLNQGFGGAIQGFQANRNMQLQANIAGSQAQGAAMGGLMSGIGTAAGFAL